MSAEAVAEPIAEIPPALAWLTLRRARAIGWGAFVVGVPFRVIALWLASRMDADAVGFALGLGFGAFVAAIALGTCCALVGAIIVSRLPGNSLGWLYVLVGATQAVMTVLLSYAGVFLPTGETQPAVLFTWLNGIVDFAFPLAGVALALALFPDGRFVGPRWGWIGALAIGGGALRALEVAFGSPTLVLMANAANPYRASGVLGDLFGALDRAAIGLVLLVLAAVAGAISLAVRYRRAGLELRRQIRWLLMSGVLILVCSLPLAYTQLVPGARDPGFDALAVSFTSLSLGPIATLIAITRYRLYEIDRIVNRTVLYGALTAILAGVFTAGIALAQRLFVALTNEKSDAAIVLTTLVVATLYAPLRKRLEAIVDRRFKFDGLGFGAYRDELRRELSLIEPRRAAARLIGEAVAELRASGGAILGDRGEVIASAGAWPVEPVLRVSLRAGDDRRSTLVVGSRGDGRSHDPAGVRALEEVAALAWEAMTLER